MVITTLAYREVCCMYGMVLVCLDIAVKKFAVVVTEV